VAEPISPFDSITASARFFPIPPVPPQSVQQPISQLPKVDEVPAAPVSKRARPVPVVEDEEEEDQSDCEEYDGSTTNGFDEDDDEDKRVRNDAGKARFPCRIADCNQMFTTFANMKRHEKLHNGDRPHPCPHDGCTKSFARKYDLKVHARVHSNEKPYLCPHANCGKRFSRKSSLKEHQRNIHDDVFPPNGSVVKAANIGTSTDVILAGAPPALQQYEQSVYDEDESPPTQWVHEESQGSYAIVSKIEPHDDLQMGVPEIVDFINSLVQPSTPQGTMEHTLDNFFEDRSVQWPVGTIQCADELDLTFV